MRALGTRLHSAATAVYWHVGSRERLIALAADRAWAEVELPDPAGVGWRTAARLATRGTSDASSQARSDDLREAPETIAEANRGLQ
jgi:hypothetical protein